MVDKSRSRNRMDAPDEVERMEDEGAAGTAVDPAPALADEIVELRRDRDNLQDRLLRQAAEFDNYRKRIDRERRELSEFAAADVLQDILPLVDDFELALKSDAPASEPYRQGLEIIHRGLLELLRKRGVTPVDAVGADFDPHVHQAVSYE
jgi:molecular chaperone GrpE